MKIKNRRIINNCIADTIQKLIKITRGDIQSPVGICQNIVIDYEDFDRNQFNIIIYDTFKIYTNYEDNTNNTKIYIQITVNFINDINTDDLGNVVY